MNDLTVLILVPNARDRIERCLESVRWADDIFCVVDPKCADGSDEVARGVSSHVVVHEYVNAAAQRNWALPQINTEWTLVLDADEFLSDALIDRVKRVIKDPASLDGYDILRHSYFFGKLIKHCGWHRDYNLRLFRSAKGRYLDRRVHSKVVVDGTVGRINDVMYHDTYRTFDEYFATSMRFTTWGAQDAYDRGKRARLIRPHPAPRPEILQDVHLAPRLSRRLPRRRPLRPVRLQRVPKIRQNLEPPPHKRPQNPGQRVAGERGGGRPFPCGTAAPGCRSCAIQQPSPVFL